MEEESKCLICGKSLGTYNSKKERCKAHRYKRINPSSKKGVRVQYNTGRTHFKKGQIPWNKGQVWTEEMKEAQSKRLKGKTMPKPKGFSETMRAVNPPLGKKIKFDSRDKEKELRVWRHGYVFVYKPDHPTSRKTPPDYGYIAEHRFVMEVHLDRELTDKEVIHHIDGDKSNNKIENLLCCEKQRGHNRIHTQMEIFIEKLIREGVVYYDREKREFRFR